MQAMRKQKASKKNFHFDVKQQARRNVQAIKVLKENFNKQFA